MDAFVWDARFETGLETVDAQHHHLVGLVNQAGDALVADTHDEEALQAFFSQLAAYAQYHFAEEERLMADVALDSRHVQVHTRHHAEFVQQVGLMWESRAQSAHPAAMLHGFLASWLTVHILGEDQAMARMIQDVRAGLPADQAYDREHRQQDHSVGALLDALFKLYGVLSEQNRDLVNANQGLETKVAERTQDLARANTRLEAEQARLRSALARIEEAQSQLVRSEKLASLGRMVAGFAHELNTPVGVALGAVSQADDSVERVFELLLREEVSEAELRLLLDTLRESSRLALGNLRRAADLVSRFKRSSIDQASEAPRPFDPREVMNDVLSALGNSLRHVPVSVHVECPDGLYLNGVPGLLEQVLTNLILNSLQHGFADGRAGHIHLRADYRDDLGLELNFRDDGAGMTAEVANRAFEPFFTTRRAQGGSGLGLYVCYSIVTERLGGRITCDSEPGRGCHFRIQIPMARAAAGSPAAPTPPQEKQP